jgi:hypothetical protein
MIGSERRKNPRAKLENFAYISLGEDSYGSVLNVSESGLCFLSNLPVEKNKTVSFWFSEGSHRIEATGEVTWVDETQKTGGLRFTALPFEARAQIQEWLGHARLPLGVGATAPAGPISTRAGASPVPIAYPPQITLPSSLRVFSGGLATGLLLSMIVAFAFLFQTHQRQFGESLIRLGQKFASKPQPAAAMVANDPPALSGPPAPQEVLSMPRPATVATQAALRTTTPTPTPAAVPSVEKATPQPAENLPKPAAAKLEQAKLTTDATAPSSAPIKAPAHVEAPPIRSVTPMVSLPAAGLPVINVATAKPPTVIPPEPTNRSADQGQVAREEPRTQSSGPPPEMFLEVGKFKDRSVAHKETDELAQLGFPTSLVQKGRLWANSYVVLVGPFNDEDAATEANKNLLSRDFKPRPFERGSRNVSLGPKLVLNGAPVPGGDCTISWESYITDTSVKFVQDHFVVSTASGKWVKSDVTFKRDAFVYRKNGDGSRTLLEIQFAGLNKTLVFAKSS